MHPPPSFPVPLPSRLAAGLSGLFLATLSLPAQPFQDPAPLAARWFPTPQPEPTFHTPGSFRQDWSTAAEVYSLMDALAAASEHWQVTRIGRSELGADIRALIRTSPRPQALTVLIQARVHGNEPATTEGLLACAYQLVHGSLQGLDLNLILIPILNPEGAAAMERVTASDLDANRDYVLQNSGLTRAVYRLLAQYDPEVVLDMHEYSPWGRVGTPEDPGSFTLPNDLLLACPNNPNLPPSLRAFARETFVPAVSHATKAHGLRSATYELVDQVEGNLRVRESATTFVSAKNALALGGRLSFLSEGRGIGLGNQHFQRRTLTQYLTARTFLTTAAEHETAIKRLIADVRAAIASESGTWKLAVEPRRYPSTYTLIGVGSNEMEPVPVEFWDRSGSTLTRDIPVPDAYLIDASQAAIAERLLRMGVRLEQLDTDRPMEVEVLRVSAFTPSANVLYGGDKYTAAGHLLRPPLRRDHALAVDSRREKRTIPAGSWIARTRQPMALYLMILEPECASGLATLSYWGTDLPPGYEFPVYRLR